MVRVTLLVLSLFSTAHGYFSHAVHSRAPAVAASSARRPSLVTLSESSGASSPSYKLLESRLNEAEALLARLKKEKADATWSEVADTKKALIACGLAVYGAAVFLFGVNVAGSEDACAPAVAGKKGVVVAKKVIRRGCRRRHPLPPPACGGPLPAWRRKRCGRAAM